MSSSISSTSSLWIRLWPMYRLAVRVGGEPRKVPHGASSKHRPRAILYAASKAPRRGRRMDERGR